MKKDYIFLIPKLNQNLLPNGNIATPLKLMIKADGQHVLVIKNLNENEYKTCDKLSKMVLEDFKSATSSLNILPEENTTLYSSIFKAYTEVLNELNLNIEIESLNNVDFDIKEAIYFDNEQNEMKRTHPENFGVEKQNLYDGMEI